jgi:hypothetical protein
MATEVNLWEGWGRPFNGKKLHYFRALYGLGYQKRSLCGRWTVFHMGTGGSLRTSYSNSTHVCTSCRKKRDEEIGGS